MWLKRNIILRDAKVLTNGLMKRILPCRKILYFWDTSIVFDLSICNYNRKIHLQSFLYFRLPHLGKFPSPRMTHRMTTFNHYNPEKWPKQPISRRKCCGKIKEENRCVTLHNLWPRIFNFKNKTFTSYINLHKMVALVHKFTLLFSMSR